MFSKKFVALGLALTLTASGSVFAQNQKTAKQSTLVQLQSTIQKAADSVKASLVLIYVERKGVEKAVPGFLKRRLGSYGQTSEGYYLRPKGPSVGVVYGDEGVVLTSIYNTSGDKIGKIWVLGADGKRREAKLLGSDPNLDIQALKVSDFSGLTPAKIGDSKSLKPGKMVVLTARTEGSEQAITTFGIVSALDRKRRNAIQVSSRVNYGNNGGAVINMAGELIAISAFHSNAEPTGQNSGVGFAAPVHLINESLATIVSGKSIPRIKQPFLGIEGDRRRSANTDPNAKKAGVRIARVLEGSAAQKAGMKAGDVIKIFNGVELEDFLMLRDEILTLRVGDEILVTILRGGWEKEFTVKLGERGPEQQR